MQFDILVTVTVVDDEGNEVYNGQTSTSAPSLNVARAIRGLADTLAREGYATVYEGS